MKFLKAAALLLFLSFLPARTKGVVITTQKIASVDVQEVYENLVIVHRGRAEIQALVQQKRAEVEDLQKSIDELRAVIEKIEEAPRSLDEDEEILPGMEEEIDSSRPQQLEELKELLSEKESDMRSLKESAGEMLEEKEESYRRRIMGKIYDALEEISQNEGYTAVLDGEIIFFQGEGVVNITDRVIEKLNEKAHAD